MIELYHEDCRETLRRIPKGSIDMILQDPPFGVTRNAWDKKPDLSVMWPEWLRVIKPNGAIVFKAQQPFASELIASMSKYFRYDLIWHKKGSPTGFLNANKMPLRCHEYILVFYKKLPHYAPQMTVGKQQNHSRGKSKGKRKTNHYGKYDPNTYAPPTFEKHPTSVLTFDAVKKPKHPNETPVDLMRWLIRTYSRPGDTIFDGYAGVAPVAIGCIHEGRNYIGSELEQEYFEIAQAEIQTNAATTRKQPPPHPTPHPAVENQQKAGYRRPDQLRFW